jgi:D-arabinose 5-phosphate isomerase GutQ
VLLRPPATADGWDDVLATVDRLHVVGTTTTPSVAAGDVGVGISGSGTTAGTVRTAEQAVAAERRCMP